MKIVVNTRLLLTNKLEGIGWFTFQTLKRIVRSHLDVEFIFLFDRCYDPAFIFSPNVTPVVLRPPARHPLLWYLFFEWSVPRFLKKQKADLFLSTDAFLSLKCTIPQLLVIHDINFEHYPEFIKPYWQSKYLHYYSRKFAEKATHLATVSEYSRQDIIATYGIVPEKIDVIYSGANEYYHPLDEEQKQEVRARYAEGEAFFVYVGSLHKRKNIVNMLRAFDLFKLHSGSQTRFVVVGSAMWDNEEVNDVLNDMRYRDHVHFVRRLESEELGRVTASALALMYVSRFEGFGLPIIEAFSAETPVITSNVSSMPEVAGDAALLCDPLRPEPIARAMYALESNPELRQDLIAKGRLQREKFSWDKTADKLWELILKTAQHQGL